MSDTIREVYELVKQCGGEALDNEDIVAGLPQYGKLAAKMYHAIRAHVEARCVWTEDEDGVWNTGCDHRFYFEDGSTLKDNDVKFCLYCGAPIERKDAAGDAMGTQAGTIGAACALPQPAEENTGCLS